MLTLQAKRLSTGETRSFTFNDLYGYEGESCGVLIYGSDEYKHLSGGGCWELCYNKDSYLYPEGIRTSGGLNPDLEITILNT